MSPNSSPVSDLEVRITGVAHGGDGIGRIDTMVCFVAGTLPGDVVRIRIFRRTKNALWGQLLEILSSSTQRITDAPCADRACAASCAWHNFSYPAQSEWKQRILAESLKRIGRIQIDVAFVENQALRQGYRTRAVFHGDGTNLGYYAPRTHDVVPLPDCPLNHPRLNEALAALRPLGLHGNIYATVNPEGTETLLYMNESLPRLRAQFPLTNLFGDNERSNFLFDGVPIVNGTFSQASLLLNRMLRHETDAAIGDAESLLDLYCGNGNLSLHHTEKREVCGVDHTAAAISAAKEQAPDCYQRGDEHTMETLIQNRAWDVILLDPPRTGAKNLMKALTTARAARIVYVSCNPATFARDAAALTSGDWHLTSLTALDMFPYTPHVESIGVFEKK